MGFLCSALSSMIPLWARSCRFMPVRLASGNSRQKMRHEFKASIKPSHARPFCRFKASIIAAFRTRFNSHAPSVQLTDETRMPSISPSLLSQRPHRYCIRSKSREVVFTITFSLHCILSLSLPFSTWMPSTRDFS